MKVSRKRNQMTEKLIPMGILGHKNLKDIVLCCLEMPTEAVGSTCVGPVGVLCISSLVYQVTTLRKAWGRLAIEALLMDALGR